MRLARPLAAAVLVAAALSAPQPAQAAVFKHPGVLVSRGQLDFVKANLGNEPWKSAWKALQRSSFASLSYTAEPRATVECGGWAAFGRPIAGDFNGDGVGDLAAVKKDGNTLHIWNGKGSNGFSGAVALGPGWEPYASSLMSLGDVNGDGRTDIGAVHGETGTLTVWNGKGGNRFGPAIPIGPGWNPYF
ncbi:Repeat domain-containing protein [Nonomuraea solani]|uniref:Repeat domain-containing protein n=1 Tax=Nonomuraea solani TaxID=1144553 RepID=A0A1H6EKP7_9ACTN|nr:VCBS repeat-containing protein [Nonomuraea solani]SEG97691.1 Repeat domain-containing protein [Nonomuraea solani]